MILFLLLLLAGAAWAAPVDVNTATAEELETLPGIGLAKAEAIVAYRTQHGPFATLAGLDDVPGIGAATLAGLRTTATVGETSDGAPPRSDTPPGEQPVATATGAIDINAATVADLQQLPGIGATKAEAILQDRDMNGPFSSCQDLTRVAGIGPATVAAMGDRCTTGR